MFFFEGGMMNPLCCYHCQKKPQENETYKACGNCQSILYCGKKCQSDSWKVHKPACKALKNLAAQIPKGSETVSEFYDGRSFTPISQDEFFRMTGVKFIRGNQALPVLVTKLMKIYPGLFADPVVNKDLICLTKEEGMGYGVIAKTAIQDNEIISALLGTIVSQEFLMHRSLSYRSGIYHGYYIDPSTRGNLAGLINDGPPNCYAFFIQGVRQHVFVKAMRPIQEKECLYTDYGSGHVVKEGLYRISDESMKVLADFCAKHNPYEPTTLYEKNMANYIFGTFHVFMKLHLKGILLSEKTLEKIEFVKEAASGGFALDDYPAILAFISEISGNSDLLKGIDDLGKEITGRSYYQIILCLIEIKPLRNSMRVCRDCAQFYDQITLSVNGSLIVRYTGCFDEPKDLPFALDALIEKFFDLPEFFRDIVIQLVENQIKIEKHQNTNIEIGKYKAQALEKFKAKLTKPSKSDEKMPRESD